MTATFYVGDAIEVMDKLPEKSVDLILTSPPFLALRSYLPADHPDKALEGGSQATPGVYIDWLIDVVEACDRVLASHGSLCIELGDTYAGSSIETREAVLEGSARWGGEDGRPTLTGGRGGTVDRKGTGWPLAKSLSLIPELFRLTLVYGTNPLTGRQTERWRLRNVVRWVRPNPPVGALGDKFRPATSELMVFCKSAKRYFDLDAVREPYADPTRYGKDQGYRKEPDYAGTDVKSAWTNKPGFILQDRGGAPPLDWWKASETAISRRQSLAAALDPAARGYGWLRVLEDAARERLAQLPDDNEPGNTPPLLRLPCKHGMYDGHVPTDHREPKWCEGGEFLSDSTAPLNWWNIPLLEGEEETRYGPKAPKPSGGPTGFGAWDSDKDKSGVKRRVENTIAHELGAPPLDWWEIPPGGYQGSHYAVFPPELCIKPIKAMCPERVCNALICVHCDRPHGTIHATTIGQFAACPEEIPLEGSVQEELRHLWGVLREQESLDVFPKVSVGAQAGDIRASRSEVEGDRGVGSYLSPGLHQDSQEGSSPSGERLRPRASAGDGRTPRPLPGAVGTDSPQERNQGRQPARELGDRAEHDSPGQGHLPELRSGLLRSLTCPHCGESGFRQCGEPSRRIVSTANATDERQALADYLRSQREAAGVTVKELAAHFPSVSGGMTGCVWNWENAANVPTAEQWPILKGLLTLDDRFDELITGERTWTESEVDYEYVNNDRAGLTQDAKGKMYRRLESRQHRIAPDRFSDCGHDDWRPGMVFDPFVGSGTTLMVATGHGRDAIGIDLDSRNYDLALERVGAFLLEPGIVG